MPTPRASPGLLAALAAALVVAVVAAHWTALDARAYCFDDQQYLVENFLVRDPSWNSVARFFGEVLNPSTVGGYYQPMAMTSLMLDVAMGGGPDNLWPFHRTSLVLHAMNVLLIFAFLYLLWTRSSAFNASSAACAAAFAALLFGVHPLTVEPIPWIGERKTLFAAFFSLWALIFYVRYVQRPRAAWYIACFVAFAFALVSKPTSTPLPLVLLLMDFWPLRRLSWRSIKEKIPFFALAVVSAIITYLSQKNTSVVVMPGEHEHAFRAPLVVCHNIVFYLCKMVWPTNLSPHYAPPVPFSLSDPMLLAGVVGTAVLIPLLILSLRWTRALAAGWLMFFIALLPTMQIIGFSNVMASDKYAYLPAIGLLIVLSYLLLRVWTATKTGRPRAGPRVAVAAVVLLLAAAEARATRKYLKQWRDTESLYRHMIAVTPWAPNPYGILGHFLIDWGRLDEGFALVMQSRDRGANSPQVQIDVGSAYKAKGDLDHAIEHYAIAIDLQPANPFAHGNLGMAFAAKGQFDAAIAEFAEAQRLNPRFPENHYNWATVLIQQNRIPEAMDHLREALRLRPNHADAHNNVGLILARAGRLPEAIASFSEALRYRPQDIEARFNLACALDDSGRLEEAVREYREVLRVAPNDAVAAQRLQSALARQGATDRRGP